jgi:hypothetical protein
MDQIMERPVLRPLAPLPGTTRDPLYPDSDGQPMGETGFHVRVLIYLRVALQEHYRARTSTSPPNKNSAKSAHKWQG